MKPFLERSTVVFVLATLVACQPNAMVGDVTSGLMQELRWDGPEGFHEWGKTNDGFFGTYAPPDTFDFWAWDGNSLKRHIDPNAPHAMHVTPLQKGLCLSCIKPAKEDEEWPLVLSSIQSSKKIAEWRPPTGWYFSRLGSSRDGKSVAILLKQWDGLKCGILDVEKQKLEWKYEFAGPVYGDIRSVAITNDQKYVAVCGWDNSLVVIGIEANQVMWKGKPSGAVNPGYGAFSDDNQKLYTADSGGGTVYSFEVSSGRLLSEWQMKEPQASGYQRISCLAIGPDDKWIAVGTGPEAKVFVFGTSDGSKPTVLPHGECGTILITSFSPDSKYLASVGNGKIKIWGVQH